MARSSWTLVGLFAIACSAPPAREQASPPPVRVDRVRLVERIPTTHGTAELVPLRRATLSVEAPGRIVAVEAERGQAVAADQPLLRLDVGRSAVAAQASAAQVRQSEAALAQAERERRLAEQLTRSGSASRRSLEQALDAESLARAALDSARAQGRVARRGLTEAVVRAPFRGVVVERHVELGEFVAPGAPVVTLMDASTLRAQVLLDPRLALDVRAGARAWATVYARPDERFEAEVLRVGEAIDPSTRRLPVELELRGGAARLRPGLVGRFEVQTGPARDVLTLDADAPFERFELLQVHVVDDGSIARRRAVRIGSLEGGRVEVLEGLEEGELVVVEGQDRVLDGQPVRIVDPTPEPVAERHR